MPRSAFPPCPPASALRLRADWRRLCRDIGARHAGGPGERQAMSFIAERFAAAGLSVRREPVPCRSLVDSRSAVAARSAGRWQACDSLCLVNSASTPGGKPVEGEIAWFECPENLHRLRPGSLRNRVMLMFGPGPGDAAGYQRLIAAQPAAILQVDDREPFTWPIRNGLLPEWVGRYGAVPTLVIAFRTAWNWRARGFTHARVAATVRHARALSANIIGTLPGSDPAEPSLLFGAHHDTPPGVVGADDNASGVVCLLELARMFAACPGRRRTLHFASFGVEEQLSVGSAHYVRRHRRTLNQIGLVVNFDSVSSPLGHSRLFHSGQPGLAGYFQAGLRQGGYDAEVDPTITPFSDHFPFTAFGIPAVWFYRSNVRGGQRWQHHSGHDTLANVSAEELCRLLNALAPPVLSLAGRAAWPFGRKVPAAVAARTAQYARQWYGLRV